MRTTGDTAYMEALQAALAAEHAAVWASGRAAGELSGRARTRALRELDAHRVARDDLRSALVAAGAEPVQAAPAYVEPVPVTSVGTARQLLVHVWSGLAAAYADVAAASPQGGRLTAIASSTEAAERAVAWGGPPQAFPGI